MTYEYVCTACGHAWEAEQSISAAPLTDCPSCQAKSAKRQVSGGAGFILKGGGWYSDLYSSAPAKKSEDASGATSDASAKKETTSADTTASKPKADGGSGSGSGTSSSSGSGGTGSSSSGGGKSSGASAA
jgi:putative FmdB family regulatory protein